MRKREGTHVDELDLCVLLLFLDDDLLLPLALRCTGRSQHALENRFDLRLRRRGVKSFGSNVAGAKILDLVFHERDERGNDDLWKES